MTFSSYRSGKTPVSARSRLRRDGLGLWRHGTRLQELRCGVPESALAFRVVDDGFCVAFFVADDEGAVAQMRPAVVEND